MQTTDSIVAQVGEAADRLFQDMAGLGGRAAQDGMAQGVWDGPSWARITDAGLDRLLADDLEGEGWAAANAALAAWGRHAVPAPLPETLVARGLLRHAGGDDALTGPLALAALADSGPARLERRGERVVLAGGALAVPWGRHAAHVLVVGPCEGAQVLAVWSAKAGPLQIRPGMTMAWEPSDRLDWGDRPCDTWHTLPPSADARAMAALSTACAMVGAAGRVLDLSLRYANDRVQFGRSIGRFQALQHALATLSCEVAAATMAVAVACDAADRGPAIAQVAVAKIRAGQAANVAADVGHQVHGAIGFTDEHGLHHLTRRLWAWRRQWGTERDWSLALGTQALPGRGASLWPLIVGLSAGAA